MKSFALGCALASLLVSAPAFSASDFLTELTIPIESARSSLVLERTVADPKAIFLHYEVALDSSTSVVRPLKISGTTTNPIMQVRLKKCMGPICREVDLDGSIHVAEIRGDCDRDFQMEADLARSSQEVRDMYNRLDVKICYKGAPDGAGSLLMRASANQGPKYSGGFMQKEMFKMLKLQIPNIVKAIKITLKEKENP
ncbi:MAG TPA: hypothetical protein VIH99_10320 [Bdellovibrionota bacterium]|jgi:hypothetical protein